MALLTTLRGSGDKFRDDFSLAFDGTDDYIQTGAVLSYNVNTVSAWFKFVANSENKIIIDTRDANDDGILLYVGGDERLYYNNDTVDANTGILTGGVWYHAVGTNDGSTSSLYLNGVLQTTADTSGVTVETAANLKIGARSHTSGASFFEGNISEVAIYNAALSASQVKTLYNGREPYNHREGIASGNLQGWWRMGDGKFDMQKHERGASYITNSDVKNYVVSNEVVIPTLSDELYTTANALANKNNTNTITGLLVVEGGSTITSGTAQIDTGLSGGRYAIHIDVSADADRVVEDLSGICTVGKAYRLTCVAKHGGSGDAAAVRLASNDTIFNNVTNIEALGTSEDGWAYYGLNFIYSANTRYFGVRETGGSHNQEFWVEKLSVKEFNTGTGVMTNMSITDFEGDTP